MCGGTLFQASVRLGVPAGVEIDELRDALEALADDLMVDLCPEDESLEPVELGHVR